MGPKELHYFGSDLNINQEPLSEADYMSYFGGTENMTGESSVWYLYSKNAAEEIREFNPDAKIIVLLRDPISFIASLHSQFLYDGDELEKNPNRAIFKEDYGESVNFRSRPPYLEAASFGTQLERYYTQFGPSNVKVVLMDEMFADTRAVYFSILDFLNLPEREVDFEKQNTRKSLRSPRLQKALRSKPEALKKIAKVLLPSKELRHRIMQNIEFLNQGGRIAEITKENKSRIIVELDSEISKVESLTGFDLKHWRECVE